MARCTTIKIFKTIFHDGNIFLQPFADTILIHMQRSEETETVH